MVGARRSINGSAPFCAGSFAGGTACDDNQFSVPTVSPQTGHLYVAFENFDTEDENQWLVVRSKDGGATFAGPVLRHAGLRRQPAPEGRTASPAERTASTLTNSCFRVPYTGAIVADKRGGAFADDLYLVMEDNRNGTRDSTNTDVFFFKSHGRRLELDRADAREQRRVRRAGEPRLRSRWPARPPGRRPRERTGNDQFWPWIDINEKGHLNVVFKDRRLDVDSIASEWPTSRARPGNYLVWTWGGAVPGQARATRRGASATGCRGDPAADGGGQPVRAIPGRGADVTGRGDNFGISDVPSNYDYSFRAGIFAGDYESVARWTENRPTR